MAAPKNNQNDANDENAKPNLDDEVVTREDVRIKKPVQFVADESGMVYSNTDTTPVWRMIAGESYLTHIRMIPKKEQGKLYILAAKKTDKGAEEVHESKSRKTLKCNIGAGLAGFDLPHVPGTNKVFTVYFDANTVYGPALVLDVKSLGSKIIKTRGPRKKKLTETKGNPEAKHTSPDEKTEPPK